LRFLKMLARWIFIFSIPLFCLTLAINSEFSTAWFYTRGFEEYNVDLRTGLSQEDLVIVADKFVEYFNSSQERISITFGDFKLPLFTPNEVTHFQDVKNLVIFDRRVILGSLGVILLGVIWWQRRDRHTLGKSLLAGGILTAVLLVLFMVGAGVNFDWLFLQFHRLSFSNNFWYSNGYMTMLFPQEFWYDMAMFTILITAVTAAVIGGAGYALMWFTRKQDSD
jgi:integral membrane protein (TIGR01906 family)